MRCVVNKIIFLLFTLSVVGCGADKEISGSAKSAVEPDQVKRAFVAGIATETHTGAPFFTRFEDFESSGIEIYKNAASERGWSVVFGNVVEAPPANRILRGAYAELKGNLLSELKQALPVDMVMLQLHGAAVAQGEDDVEGDLLQAVRDIVGEDVPIGTGMDAHSHLSQRMVDVADIMVFFKEWPHIDAEETMLRAFNLTADVAEGKYSPHMAMYNPRMIADYHTLKEPLKPLVDEMKAAESDEDVLVVNFVHGFSNGDVPDMGSKILVITDNNPDKGSRLAEEFGQRLFALRGKTAVYPQEFEEGLASALASSNHPVVIADYADMPFGGAPGDATFILSALLERGVENAIIAGLWDPMALEVVKDLAVGDRLNLRIGGKTGPMSGRPLDLEVEIRYIGKDMYLSGDYRRPPTETDRTAVGTIAVVRAQGIDIVLVEKRYPIYGYTVLEWLGMRPAQSRMIVVKSANNFYSGYVDIAGDVVYMFSPGLINSTVGQGMTEISRPLWPYDENPFAAN